MRIHDFSLQFMIAIENKISSLAHSQQEQKIVLVFSIFFFI